jgi:metallo-beta-lactamase class B
VARVLTRTRAVRVVRQPAIAAISLLVLGLGTTTPVVAQQSEFFRKMNQPEEPFRIAGNLHYVGTNSVTAFLITTPEGHILIDSGFVETVPMIESSVKKLGFDLADVRILLNSHAHIDHAGGLAKLKRMTGAKMIASALDTPLLERGGRGDDLHGDEIAYEPVTVDRKLADGDTVQLGGTTLTARITAGHTRGCTSWVMEIEEGEQNLTAVSICSLSVLEGMKFESEPTYPGIATDFARSYETLRSIPCDIFLASHAGFFKMSDKLGRRKSGEPGNPFIDRPGYLAYIERSEKKFNEWVQRERESTKPE